MALFGGGEAARAAGGEGEDVLLQARRFRFPPRDSSGSEEEEGEGGCTVESPEEPSPSVLASARAVHAVVWACAVVAASVGIALARVWVAIRSAVLTTAEEMWDLREVVDAAALHAVDEAKADHDDVQSQSHISNKERLEPTTLVPAARHGPADVAMSPTTPIQMMNFGSVDVPTPVTKGLPIVHEEDGHEGESSGSDDVPATDGGAKEMPVFAPEAAAVSPRRPGIGRYRNEGHCGPDDGREPGMDGVPPRRLRRFRRGRALTSADTRRSNHGTRTLPPPEAIAISKAMLAIGVESVDTSTPLPPSTAACYNNGLSSADDGDSDMDVDEDGTPVLPPPMPLSPEEFVMLTPIGAPLPESSSSCSDDLGMRSSAFQTSVASVLTTPSAGDDITFHSFAVGSDDIESPQTSWFPRRGDAPAEPETCSASQTPGCAWRTPAAMPPAASPPHADARAGRGLFNSPLPQMPATQHHTVREGLTGWRKCVADNWCEWVAKGADFSALKPNGARRPGATARRVARAMKSEARRALERIETNRGGAHF